jgi:hypothetical protein
VFWIFLICPIKKSFHRGTWEHINIGGCPSLHNSLGIFCWGRSLKIQKRNIKRDFYTWKNIWEGAWSEPGAPFYNAFFTNIASISTRFWKLFPKSGSFFSCAFSANPSGPVPLSCSSWVASEIQPCATELCSLPFRDQITGRGLNITCCVQACFLQLPSVY